MKILKNLFLMAFALTAVAAMNLTTAYAGDINADSITGKWKDTDNPAIVEIQNKGSYYEGVIVEDSENPGVVSTVIFKNLVYDGAKGIWEGKVYSVKRQKDYDVEIRMSDSTKFTMTVDAGLRSKKVEWGRVQ